MYLLVGGGFAGAPLIIVVAKMLGQWRRQITDRRIGCYQDNRFPIKGVLGMFAWLVGDVILKWRILILAVWIAALIALRLTAPPFADMAKGGQFVFLPDIMPSRQGEEAFDRTFPGREATSSMVIVASRDDGPLTDEDRTYIDETLKPAVESFRDRTNTSSQNAVKHPIAPKQQNKEQALVGGHSHLLNTRDWRIAGQRRSEGESDHDRNE